MEFPGDTYAAKFVLADIALEVPSAADDQATINLSPRGVTVLGRLPGGNQRMVATVEDGSDRELVVDRAFVEDLLQERGISATPLAEPAWSSQFRIHHRVADRFRVDRVFLAGDAAHIHSPAAGQGMNTGIADGFDIAAKLAAVLRGESDELTLDLYDQRRRAALRGAEVHRPDHAGRHPQEPCCTGDAPAAGPHHGAEHPDQASRGHVGDRPRADPLRRPARRKYRSSSCLPAPGPVIPVTVHQQGNRAAKNGTLILGGGFGGAHVARLLGQPGATIVSPENSMLYTPLLPEVAAGVIEPRHAFVPLRIMCPHAELLRGRASALDQEARTVTVDTDSVRSRWRTSVWSSPSARQRGCCRSRG